MTTSEHPPFTICRATAEHSFGILECLRIAFEPYRHRYTPAAYHDTVLTPETVGRRLAEMVVLVAQTEVGGIVGTIGYSLAKDGEGHIRGMAVLPAWQGSGVAQRLLESVESELRGKGCSRITLDTTALLARARAFYERNGFRLSGRVADFFGMPLYEFEKVLD